MQINTQNIKRPNLFSNFFGKELDYKNEFVSYIDTFSNNSNIVHKSNVTSNICKTAKSLTNNIEKRLKTKKFGLTNPKLKFQHMSFKARLFNEFEKALTLIFILKQYGTYEKYSASTDSCETRLKKFNLLKHGLLIKIGKKIKRAQRELRESESILGKKDEVLRSAMRELGKQRDRYKNYALT